jgi:hypothetical protein
VSETHGNKDEILNYPIANVLQSAAGANAVIGSKIVRAEMCSEVEGSNRITFPCALPDALC